MENERERKGEQRKTEKEKEGDSITFCFFSGMDPPLVCLPGLKMRKRAQRRRR